MFQIFFSLEHGPPKGNSIMQGYAKMRDYPFQVLSRHPAVVSNVIKATIFILYNIYLAFAIKYMYDNDQVNVMLLKLMLLPVIYHQRFTSRNSKNYIFSF